MKVLVAVRLSTYSRPSTRSAEAMSGEHIALRTLWSRMDWPRNRVSAGAFCETTATRSCMTLSAIERGTCTGCGVAQAASGDRGHQLAGLLVPEHDGDPVHAMISNVMSTTVRSRRSRSSSAESFWETSSSICSFRAWRASPRVALDPELAAAGGPSRLVMPGGTPPLTTSCRTICPPAARPPRRWRGAGSPARAEPAHRRAGTPPCRR